MKKSIMKKWVAALRSGEFKQVKGYLEHNNRYCCLGVLSVLAMCEGICDFDKRGMRYDGESYDLPLSVRRWAGIKTNRGAIQGLEYSLMHLNDHGASFSEIANVIEKHWKEL